MKKRILLILTICSILSVGIVSYAQDNNKGNTQLNIRIITKEGTIFDSYGTDDDVYFGVYLKDGRYQQWELDKKNYNDFESGSDDTYTVTLENATGADIRQAHIRKERRWGTLGDDWYLVDVEFFTEDGLMHHCKNINRLINTEQVIEYQVENQDIAETRLWIQTITYFYDDDGGTDSNVYFGIELENGHKYEWLLDNENKNDHEPRTGGTYERYCRRHNNSKIKRMWLRKAGLNDDWKLYVLTVDFQDERYEYYYKNYKLITNDHIYYYLPENSGIQD